MQLALDVHAAYQNALRWRLTGASEHGAAAVGILNGWASTLSAISGNADRFLAAGIYGYQLANAAELLHDHPELDKRSEEHTSELQSRGHLVCRLLLEKKE